MFFEAEKISCKECWSENIDFTIGMCLDCNFVFPLIINRQENKININMEQ
jgi:hypothetical protein